jgi:tyrosyl-tRNA synthetase
MQEADEAREGSRLALARMDRPAPEAAETAARLARNAVEVLPRGGLEERLATGRPLRAKLGLDPTAPDLHVGHTVVLQKLREFQDLGHTVVLIVGDYTARVGDPSGRSVTRPVLSPEEIDANARTYLDQAGRVLRTDDTLEVRFNSEWLSMSMEDLFRLVRVPTVAQLLERDDFAKRMAASEPISLLELLYPVLQGYDSVAVQADVELGGTDQTFNLLMGRAIQAAYGQPQQLVLTMPLLVGTDGVQKMSKSVGNQIGITDPPGEMYGKTLSLPDAALEQWYSLLLGRRVPAELSARDAKHALARALVERFHGPDAADAAADEFARVFVDRSLPSDIEEAALDAEVVHLPELLTTLFGGSRSEARRKIAQGGVRLDGEPVSELDLPAASLDGRVLQVGKRQFRRLRAG